MAHSDSSDSAYSDSEFSSDSVSSDGQSVHSDSVSSDSAYATSVYSDSACSESISSVPPQIPEPPKKPPILDEFIQFGYFYIPFMFCQQLMVLVLTSAFFFPTFGSRLPTISKCGDENFESIRLTDRCKHLEKLRASGSNCTPEFDNDFWSLPQELNYYCGTAYIVKEASIIQKIGHFVGAFIAGQLSDMFGRKKTLIVGIVGMLGSFIGVSFATDLVWYSVAMFFIALFSSYLITVDTVYLVEMVPPKHVTWSLSFIGFAPNVIVFAGLAWISHDFRTLARVCAGITTALLVMQIWCPESARWLLYKHNVEEAKNVVRRIHRWNRTLTDNKSVQMDIAFLKNSNEIELQRERENEINPNSRKKFYLYHLFATDTMEKRILSICLMCTLLYFGYYKLIFNMQHLPGNVFINVAIVGALLWLINILYGIADVKYGNIEENKNGTLFIVSFCLLFCFGVVSIKYYVGLHVIAFDATCYIILGALSFNVLIIAGVVTSRVFPTPVRNSAVGLVHFCGRFGMITELVLFYYIHPDSQETYLEGIMTFFILPFLFMWAFPLFDVHVPETDEPLSDQMPDM
uniref:MFS domain-containing protein n=1 Tax=Panagrellus redivivus TaxID=6233 RepID=A0A7E4UUH8_PANRE